MLCVEGGGGGRGEEGDTWWDVGGDGRQMVGGMW